MIYHIPKDNKSKIHIEEKEGSSYCKVFNINMYDRIDTTLPENTKNLFCKKCLFGLKIKNIRNNIIDDFKNGITQHAIKNKYKVTRHTVTNILLDEKLIECRTYNKELKSEPELKPKPYKWKAGNKNCEEWKCENDCDNCKLSLNLLLQGFDF